MTKPNRRARVGGVGAGTAAGLIWGVSFPLPELLHGWSPVAITAGRYLAYAGVSGLLFVLGGVQLRQLARRHWRLALAFALAGNVGYYLLLVLGIKLVGAPVTDIIIGCIPVTMALAGNILYSTYPWRAVLLPVGLVSIGLAIINVLEIGGAAPTQHTSTVMKVLGVISASGAVLIWTWYGLANARFLSSRTEISTVGWATVVGLGTGAVTVVALPLAVATHQLSGDRWPDDHQPGVVAFVLASLVLGVLVSWAAAGLWNITSTRLSATAAGMMLNVETVSGFTYVYAVRGRWPPPGQVAGLLFILVGVLLVVRLTTSPASATAANATPVRSPTMAAPDGSRR